MITAEKIYEVFGITPGPWNTDKQLYMIESSTLTVCLLDEGDGIDNSINADMELVKSSPEMLVALVNIAIEMIPYKNRRLDDKGHFDRIVKAIESADSQKRKWPELLKELQNE